MLEAKYARKAQALGDQRGEHREAEFTCSVSWGWCVRLCARARVRVCVCVCVYVCACSNCVSLLLLLHRFWWIKQIMFTHFSAFSVEFQDVLKMIIQFQIQKIFYGLGRSFSSVTIYSFMDSVRLY